MNVIMETDKNKNVHKSNRKNRTRTTNDSTHDFYYPTFFQLDFLHTVHKNPVKINITYIVVRVKSNIQ